MQNVKIIFHVDMNAFFCSVEEIKNPYLKGKAFAIGNEKTSRGVISTCSYEARKYGIKSAMSVIKAKEILPSLIFVDSNFELYNYYSNMFMDLLLEYTDKVFMASVDEAYMDVTDIDYIHPLSLAEEIQKRVLEELNLPCSIGIGPTLFLAKMASDMKKPLGITVLRKRELKEKLYPLDIKEMYGVGKKTYPLFYENNIKTINDFVNNYDLLIKNQKFSKKILEELYLCATGKSTDIVDPYKYNEPTSIGVSKTLNIDTDNELVLKQELKQLAIELASRIINYNKHAKTISIQIKYYNFKTTQKSKTLNEYINNQEDIFDYAYDLFLENWNFNEVRLLGITLSNFKQDIDDINLFNIPVIKNKDIEVEKLLNRLKNEFGENIIDLGIKKDNKKSK